ncbi:MAG: hypothetical protein G5Z43_000569 [Caldisphaeraceae archaeon]|nr:hypothetical protein [Caldisphaeraceae archaeon]
MNKWYAVAIIVVALVIVISAGIMQYGHKKGSVYPTTSIKSSTFSNTPNTTEEEKITFATLLSYKNSYLMPGIGNDSSKYYIIIAYDPECPYCAVELNGTLPYFYSIAEKGYARVEFVGIPVHPYSLEMIAILDLIYQKYGFQKYYMVLDKSYAQYVSSIYTYFKNQSLGLWATPPKPPTPSTLYSIMKKYNLTINASEINSTIKDLYPIIATSYQLGIQAVPTLIVYNAYTNSTILEIVGMKKESVIESEINSIIDGAK